MRLVKRSKSFAFVQGLQYLRRKFVPDYRLFNNGISFYPNTVSLELTDKCNLSCVGCKFYGESGVYKKDGVYSHAGKKSETMHFDKVKDIVDQVSFFRPLVVLTGGEPLINRDCINIINYIHKKGLVATLETNGTLIDEKIAKDLVETGISVIMFSVDGPEDVHDKWRGKIGAFRKTVNAIKYIKSFRGNNAAPILNISYTIERESFPKLVEFAKLAEEMGVDTLQFSVLNWINREIADRHKKVFRNLMHEENEFIESDIHDGALGIDTDVLIKQLREVHEFAKNSKLHIRFSPHIDKKELWKYKEYYNNLSFVLSDRCYHPWFCLTIKANGDVSSCVSTINYIYGNIFDHSFKHLWNCDKAENFRKNLKKIGYFPGCIRCPGLYSE